MRRPPRLGGWRRGAGACSRWGLVVCLGGGRGFAGRSRRCRPAGSGWREGTEPGRATLSSRFVEPVADVGTEEVAEEEQRQAGGDQPHRQEPGEEQKGHGWN